MSPWSVSLRIENKESVLTPGKNHNGVTLEFDFDKVYFNSRLNTEHRRITELFKPGQLIADVFAGVGPMAVAAAKRGSFVLANDLNPASHRWLVHNAQKNKVCLLVLSNL